LIVANYFQLRIKKRLNLSRILALIAAASLFCSAAKKKIQRKAGNRFKKRITFLFLQPEGMRPK
jgi:hypothetical protein